jgi:predicted alpha/beta-hydrolase family hydrolase
MADVLIDGPERDARTTLILAPGAGGGIRSPFMATVARDVAAAGIRVIRFEFDYIAEGRKRPDPAPRLLDNWRAILSRFGNDAFIGGKSMGGRMASMLADEARVRGLTCLGYPFHPPGQPQKLRTSHLETIATPTLIVQGTRDAFGTREEVAGYRLSPAIRIRWIDGADHSFRNRQHVAAAVAELVSFVTST